MDERQPPTLASLAQLVASQCKGVNETKETQRHQRTYHAIIGAGQTAGHVTDRLRLQIRRLLAPGSLRVVEADILARARLKDLWVVCTCPLREPIGRVADRCGALPLRHGAAAAPDRIVAVG